MNWRELWRETARVLGAESASPETGQATNEARWLCEEASGAFGDEWLTVLDEPVGERAVGRLDAMLARYRAGEPLQYVLGHWSFRHLDLMVDRRVLIPRPETEELVELALDELARIGRRARVVDIGTGTGAIALSIASERPLGSVDVWATDVSEEALAVARANTAGLGRAASHVRIVSGDVFAGLPDDLAGAIDIVVSNPPYIGDDDPDIEQAVREWEPSTALFAGADGLTVIRRLIAEAPHWLRGGGALLVEFGATQGDAIEALARAAGFAQVEIRRDLSGRQRMLVARTFSRSAESPLETSD